MKKTFSVLQREQQLTEAKSTVFDLIIIGGGITGAGILLDAQSRGLNACLVEMQDFAAGTSSKSTKLIHGGLRYVKQGDFKLVKEVARERKVLRKNMPHLISTQQVIVPIRPGSGLTRITAKVGMKIYDWLAGVGPDEKHKILSAKETLSMLPSLNPKKLKGAVLYPEYKTNDARLVLEVIRKGVEMGGTAFSYMKVNKLLYENGKIGGVQVEDLIQGETARLTSKYVVSATGPWVDEVANMDGELKKKLFLTKGVHIVVPKELFPIEEAVYFSAPDKRMIFAIPKRKKTYFGTTDTPFHEDLIHPGTTTEDVEYILKAVNENFQGLKLGMEDVESFWSGVRPLIMGKNTKNPSEISRKDELFESPSGLISIAGGKLTGFRVMAEKVMDVVAERIKKDHERVINGCSTTTIKIAPKEIAEYPPIEGLTQEVTNKLHHALHHEMIYHPLDFLARRSGWIFVNVAKLKQYYVPITSFLASQFHWSKEQEQKYLKEVEEALEQATVPQG